MPKKGKLGKFNPEIRNEANPTRLSVENLRFSNSLVSLARVIRKTGAVGEVDFHLAGFLPGNGSVQLMWFTAKSH